MIILKDVCQNIKVISTISASTNENPSVSVEGLDDREPPNPTRRGSSSTNRTNTPTANTPAAGSTQTACLNASDVAADGYDAPGPRQMALPLILSNAVGDDTIQNAVEENWMDDTPAAGSTQTVCSNTLDVAADGDDAPGAGRMALPLILSNAVGDDIIQNAVEEDWMDEAA